MPAGWNRQPVDAHGLDDVLEIAIAQIVEIGVEARDDLVHDLDTCHDLIGASDAGQAGGEVDGRTVDVELIDHHFGKVHADAQPEGLTHSRVFTPLGQAFAERTGAGHCRAGSVEDKQHPIAQARDLEPRIAEPESAIAEELPRVAMKAPRQARRKV